MARLLNLAPVLVQVRGEIPTGSPGRQLALDGGWYVREIEAIAVQEGGLNGYEAWLQDRVQYRNSYRLMLEAAGPEAVIEEQDPTLIDRNIAAANLEPAVERAVRALYELDDQIKCDGREAVVEVRPGDPPTFYVRLKPAQKSQPGGNDE